VPVIPLPTPVPAPAPAVAAAPKVHCSNCDAVCCRLLVVLLPGDDVPARFMDVSDAGLDVMKRGEDGWCVALESATHRCSIYETRPQICRKFHMGGPYCREVRNDYYDAHPRGIPLVLT
jgi:Fe-S-cluster containining protein